MVPLTSGVVEDDVVVARAPQCPMEGTAGSNWHRRLAVGADEEVGPWRAD